ncbi:trihelix transcription factor ASIL1 [Drosophila sechellia]|uniref:GM25324 n=1 Tax=Drosophila sechellia TaxID=7238 RepID=B4HFI2_DROSE|nr:trihelix transcription factor ASIL1 [Drosophila sechellia]EDW41213.1 GM25324 [Drosophila sechellia]
MPSRNIDDAAGAKEVPRSTRSTLIGPRSKRIALNSRNQSIAAAEKKTQSQLSFPPKSEYEKFYETVFLAEDSQPEENITAERRKPGPRMKSSLQALLSDEGSPTGPQRTAKINVTQKIVVEPAIRANGISPLPKNVGKEEKFADYYTKTERHVWKKDAEKMLLQLWAQHLKDFRGESKNVLIYRQMARQMSQFGPSHTELKTKMDNLSRKYRIEAERVRETGVPSKWEHFHKLQALLIGTKSVDVFEDITAENPAQALFSDEDYEPEELASIKDDSVAGDHGNVFETDLVASKAKKRTRTPSPSIPEIPEDDDEEEEEEDDDDHMKDLSPSPILKYHTKRKASTGHSDRLLEIEEEKLAIEREKLQVMKDALLELNAFHKDIVYLLKHKN